MKAEKVWVVVIGFCGLFFVYFCLCLSFILHLACGCQKVLLILELVSKLVYIGLNLFFKKHTQSGRLVIQWSNYREQKHLRL